jgi:DNA-binding HxlR family transcriptional regulator
MYPSSNLVADRLRELEGRGVIDRGKLPALASSWVYELAAWARDLEPILLALGGWGMRVPLPPARHSQRHLRDALPAKLRPP